MDLESLSQIGLRSAGERIAAYSTVPPGRVGRAPADVAGKKTGATQDSRLIESRAETTEEIELQIEKANVQLEALNQDLRFQVHEGTGQMLVEIVDRNTGETVREYPPREFLDLAARMREMIGVFLDERS